MTADPPAASPAEAAAARPAEGDRGPWLLALHSASDTLGVGLQRLPAAGAPAGIEPPRLAAFPLGRELSNQLFACLETLLPAGCWPDLARLAVCTGPGGFTGTRLTVVLARTLAQQLGVPLDGVSSFHLIARRLAMDSERFPASPFWLVRELPRHGLVAGLYAADPGQPGGIDERLPPALHRGGEALAEAAHAAGVPDAPRHPAEPLLPHDAAGLLEVALARQARGWTAPWESVLPLYPTSPVEGGR